MPGAGWASVWMSAKSSGPHWPEQLTCTHIRQSSRDPTPKLLLRPLPAGSPVTPTYVM